MEKETIEYTKYDEYEIENVKDRLYNSIRANFTALRELDLISEEGLQRVAKVTQEELYNLEEEE